METEVKIEQELPNIYVKNFFYDYTGLTYESLIIEECVDPEVREVVLAEPGNKHTRYDNSVKISKRYRCKCSLCGEERIVSCDEFGIYHNTARGKHSNKGYWSELFCDCHVISSFQWIVNSLLWENRVKYQVEYWFDGLYGVAGVNPLRFDFAVFNEDGSIKFLIECQGEQHYHPVKAYGGEKGFKRQQANDELKRDYVKEHGIKLIEISYRDKQFDKVKRTLQWHGVIQ